MPVSGKNYENDVATLFRSAGYRIEQNVEYSGQEFDIIASKIEFGELYRRIAVECKFRSSGSVSNSDVHAFINSFISSSAAHGLTHGVIVSNANFSRQAHEAVQKHPQIRLINSALLERDLLGALVYLEFSRQHYRSEFQNYVVLRGTEITDLGVATSVVADIAQTCAQRLLHTEKSFTVLLGDFGTGKTTISEQVHSMLSESYRSGTSDAFPLILYLRTLEQHATEDYFIESHLKLSSREFTIDRLEQISKKSRICLILDGFDEVATNSSEDERARLFSKVMKIAARSSSVLLTSRPSYFTNYDELQTLIHSLVQQDYASFHKLPGTQVRRDADAQAAIDVQHSIAYRKLNVGSFPSFRRDQTHIYTVNSLTKYDIIQFFKPYSDILKRYHKKTPEEMYDFLSGVYDLTDLLTRPLLLDMFVSLVKENAIRFDSPDMQIGPAGLYHLYINFHLNRDWAVRRFLRPEERLAFARGAAVAMLEAGGNLEASYDSVWNIVRNDPGILAQNRQHLLESNREGVVTDVRVCSFMNITPDGKIEFSHKSFMEYFIAEVIVAQFRTKKPIDLLNRSLNYEILYFLGSYSLVRADTRLEILQHIQHVAFNQSATYRSNIQMALLFAEQISSNRKFQDIIYPRVKISKKSFVQCQFDQVILEQAVVADVIFQDCFFGHFSVDGELHNISMNSTSGSIFVPTSITGITISRCPSISIRSLNGQKLDLQDVKIEKSQIRLADSLTIRNSLISDVTFSVTMASLIHLTDSKIEGVRFQSNTIAQRSSALPKLDLDSCKLTDVQFVFFSVTRLQFIKMENTINNCFGVVIVDDPKREIQGFSQRTSYPATRYVGWQQYGGLLLLSAEFFDKLDDSTIRNIEIAVEKSWKTRLIYKKGSRVTKIVASPGWETRIREILSGIAL